MKDKIPKDLGLKIGSKEQVVWESVAKEAKILIDQSEKNIIVQKGILETAEKKILQEKEKFK